MFENGKKQSERKCRESTADKLYTVKAQGYLTEQLLIEAEVMNDNKCKIKLHISHVCNRSLQHCRGERDYRQEGSTVLVSFLIASPTLIATIYHSLQPRGSMWKWSRLRVSDFLIILTTQHPLVKSTHTHTHAFDPHCSHTLRIISSCVWTAFSWWAKGCYRTGRRADF